MPVRQIKGVFYWETTVSGQRHYGAFNGKDGEPIPRNKAEAKDMVSAIRMQIRAGTYGRKGATNFSDFVDTVFKPYAREHHAAPGQAIARAEVLKAEFGGLGFGDITPMRIESFITTRLTSLTRFYERDDAGDVKLDAGGTPVLARRAPTTVRKEFTLLKQICQMAKIERVAAENPCDFVRKAVLKKTPSLHRRNRALTLDEERRLIPQLQGRRAHLLALVRVAQWTGMRRGEILRLGRDDLNLTGRSLFRRVGGQRHEVPAGWLFIERTKSGVPRAVPMCRRVRELLTDLAEGPHRLLFTNPNTGRPFYDLSTAFTSAVREAGIVDFHLHDLRHTWSTRADELGVPEAVRRDILGHSPGTQTAGYTHSYPAARERAVELVSTYADVLTGEGCVKNAESRTPWLAFRAS